MAVWHDTHMKKRAKPAAKRVDTAMVKTTLRLPRDLWIAARHLAIDEGIEFQHLVAAGIAGYLKEHGKSL